MNGHPKPPAIQKDLRCLRVLAAVALVGFPVGALSGLAPVVYLTSAAVVGLLYFGALLLAWRFRSYTFYALGFGVFMAGQRISESLVPHTPWAYSIQWLTLALLFTSWPVLMFRQVIIRHCPSAELENA